MAPRNIEAPWSLRYFSRPLGLASWMLLLLTLHHVILFGAPRRTGRCSWLRCGRSSRTLYLRCTICSRRLGKAPPYGRRKGVTCAPYSAQRDPIGTFLPTFPTVLILPVRPGGVRGRLRRRPLPDLLLDLSPPPPLFLGKAGPEQTSSSPRLVHRRPSPSLPVWVLLAPHLNAFLFDAPRSNRVGTWYRGGAAPVP